MKKKIEDLHKNKRFRISYQVIFIFLAVYSFTTTILDLHGDIHIFGNRLLEFIDMSIYLIFAIDYFIRFTFSKDKLDFIENNIPDLISIIPYYSIFRLFRIFKIRRFAKTFRQLKLTRTYLIIKRFRKKIKRVDLSINFCSIRNRCLSINSFLCWKIIIFQWLMVGICNGNYCWLWRCLSTHIYWKNNRHFSDTHWNGNFWDDYRSNHKLFLESASWFNPRWQFRWIYPKFPKLYRYREAGNYNFYTIYKE